MTTKPLTPEPLRSPVKEFETAADLHFAAKYATWAWDVAVTIGDGSSRVPLATTGLRGQGRR